MFYKRMIREFYRREIIEFKNLFSPVFMFKLLYKYKYVHFFLTGVSGVLINLFITWFVTSFFLGLENYFYGYCIGLCFNLIYNFALHVNVNFGVTDKVRSRFVVFVGYSLLMTFIQAILVKLITPFVGLRYYLFVICFVVLCLSFFNFAVFKFWLFRGDGK